jgi:X-X-X-Leu-X-X-Gly heptad repeat protein
MAGVQVQKKLTEGMNKLSGKLSQIESQEERQKVA